MNSRYELGEKFPNIYFTQREAECMALMLQRKKNGNIAEELGLSPRTIEYYLERMREKLGANTKFELIDMILASDFSQFKDDLIAKIND